MGLYAYKYMKVEMYDWRQVDEVGNRRLTITIKLSMVCRSNFISKERANLTY